MKLLSVILPGSTGIKHYFYVRKFITCILPENMFGKIIILDSNIIVM